MNQEFIPYNESLALKKLGFDEPCLAKYAIYNPKDSIALFPQSQDFFKGYFNYCKNSDYTDKIAAPTFSQAFKFFREKYGLHSYIEPVLVEKANSPIKYDYVILEVSHQNDLEYNNLPYHTYEEAELECLKKLIEIVKQ